MNGQASGLEVEHLSFSYGPKRALDDVSFRVERGAFCALLGPNGAGKSTLFALLTRLLTAPRGRIGIAGHDLSRTPGRALARIGVVFQQSTLDPDLTVWRNLAYFAALQGLSGRAARAGIEAGLERLGMAERAGERVRDLNGGHRRRTEIARCLVHDPAILLLDEPTVGLDAASRRAITEHVHDLSRSERLTVLWATHLSDEVADGDRLLILHQGRILEDGIAGVLRDGRPLPDYFLSRTGAAA